MTPTPHGHGHGHGHGRRGSTGALPQLPGHGHDTDSEALPPQHGSVLMGIIKQLAANSDLSRVALPAFILEPRSMLERVSDFFVHPELLLAAIDSSNELDRFVAVVRWFLAGWHVRPKGVRKPFNPVLGELFRAHWQLDSASQGQVRAYYLAEQTSHHPPKSEFLYAIPKLSVRARGELLPKSRFLGNSAASLMHGHTLLTLPSASYIITMPNVYARGILFGEMHQELGDTATVKSVEHGLEAEIEFLGRGWFRDNTNGVKGRIKKDGKVLYNLEGRWDSIVTIKGTEKHAQSTTLFDASTLVLHSPVVAPLDSQQPTESRHLWSAVSSALRSGDYDLAAEEKEKVEGEQRRLRENGSRWNPQFFGPHGLDHLDWKDTEAVEKVLEERVFGTAEPL